MFEQALQSCFDYLNATWQLWENTYCQLWECKQLPTRPPLDHLPPFAERIIDTLDPYINYGIEALPHYYSILAVLIWFLFLTFAMLPAIITRSNTLLTFSYILSTKIFIDLMNKTQKVIMKSSQHSIPPKTGFPYILDKSKCHLMVIHNYFSEVTRGVVDMLMDTYKGVKTVIEPVYCRFFECRPVSLSEEVGEIVKQWIICGGETIGDAVEAIRVNVKMIADVIQVITDDMLQDYITVIGLISWFLIIALLMSVIIKSKTRSRPKDASPSRSVPPHRTIILPQLVNATPSSLQSST